MKCSLLVVLVVIAAVSPAAADPYFDVTAPAYGAVPGDGIDDTVAIQNAINAAAASSAPGTVFFPAGLYNVNGSLYVPAAYITIKGAGGRTGQSKITHGPASEVSLFCVCQNPAPQAPSPGATGSVRIASLALVQGNASSKYLIENTRSDGLDLDEMSFEGHANNIHELVYSERSNTKVVDSKFSLRNVDAYGVHLLKVNGVPAINSAIMDSLFINVRDANLSLGRGILIDKQPTADGQVEGVTISRNVMISTGQVHVRINAALHVNITDNIIDKIGYAGVWMEATVGDVDFVVIANNYFGFFKRNGCEVGIRGSGVGDLKVRGVSVSNNKFFAGKYGIAADKNTAKWNISGNSLMGNSSGDSTGILITSIDGAFNVVGNIIEGYVSNYYATGVPRVNNVANWCGMTGC